jgi:HAD superfamily hydrolase (TIGR01484 family)
MGRYSDILLVTDFDATLTGKDRKIPKANIDAVERFKAEGGLFTIATGRSRPMFDHSAGDIATNAPHILSNGSAIYDYSRQTWVFFEDLPPDAGEVMMDLVTRFPSVYGEIQTQDEHFGFNGDPAQDDWMKAIRVFIQRRPVQEIPRPWLKLRFLYQLVNKGGGARMTGIDVPTDKIRLIDDMQAYVETVYGTSYAVERPGMLSIEVQCAGTTKGTTARRLANAYGRHTLVCVGDAKNDLSMLKEADIAFITGDAEPDMFNFGFRVAAPCGEGAIASVINAL